MYDNVWISVLIMMSVICILCFSYNFYLNGVFQFSVDGGLNWKTLTNVTSSVEGVWTCEGVNGEGNRSPVSPPEDLDVKGEWVVCFVGVCGSES